MTPNREPSRPRLAALLLLPLILAAWTSPRASTAAPARPQASALGMCDFSGWSRIGGFPPGFVATALAGAPGAERVYAVSQAQLPGGTHYGYSGLLAETSWSPIADFRDVPLTDALLTPQQPNVLAWSSGAAARNIFGAGSATPLTFGAIGSLQWVSALAESEGAVYAASGLPRGVFAWDGAAWSLRGAEGIPSPIFWALGAGGGRLWLGTDARGLWSSSDAGRTWTQAAGGLALQDATVTAVAVSPQDPAQLAAGLGPQVDSTRPPTSFRGLRRSGDGGQTWAPAVLEGTDYIPAIAYGRRRAGQLFVSRFGWGIASSEDGGQRWNMLLGPPQVEVHGNRFYDLLTLVPPSRPDCELLFAAGDGGVWVRNVSGSPDRRLYLPYGLQWREATGTGAGGLAAPEAAGQPTAEAVTRLRARESLTRRPLPPR